MMFKTFDTTIESLTGKEDPSEQDWIDTWKLFREENKFTNNRVLLDVFLQEDGVDLKERETEDIIPELAEQV